LYGEKLFCSLLHDTPSHVTTLWNYWKLKGSIRIMWIPSSGANLELNSMALFYPHFFYSPGIRKRERTLNFGKNRSHRSTILILKIAEIANPGVWRCQINAFRFLAGQSRWNILVSMIYISCCPRLVISL
jgi:hypothetical protein